INPQTRELKRYRHRLDDPGSLSTDAIWSLTEDRKGQIWLGTDKKGVSKYIRETDNFQHVMASVSDDKAIPPGAINDMMIDNNGNIWLTVSNYGARRITEGLEKFETFKNDKNNKNSLAFDNI